MKIQEILTEAAKSKKSLFTALDDFYKTDEFSKQGLDHKKIGNETYGRKSMIYVSAKDADERKALERVLQHDFGVNKNYSKGSSTTEVQVSYFKGNKWDE